MENIGAQMVKEVSSRASPRTPRQTGTTTATVYAESIFKPRASRTSPPAPTPTRSSAASTKAVKPPWSTKLAEGLQEDLRLQRADRPGRLLRPANHDEEIGQIIAQAMDKGRQGRCHHRRGGQEPRDHRRARRGHAVRQGLPLARTSSPTRPAWRPSWRTAYVLIHEKKISSGQGPPADPGQGRRVAASRPAHRRRGHRRRGPRHAGGQPPPRDPQDCRRQGPRLRRPPQGDDGGHRHPHRRPGHHGGAGHRLSRSSSSPTWAAPRRSSSTRTPPRSSRAPARVRRHPGPDPARSATRSRRPPATTTRRSCRSGSRSSPAAWPRSTWAPPPSRR